jgi:glyceraldehyde 3-phosphate dehydrogenase|tara:strand:+ start:109 stop:1134 length:1026 start_codon:yes stop_codon:yes gene_type:complete
MSSNSNKINIAIFGFGRIGRNIFRLAYKDPRFNIVAISEFGHAEALHYLLVRDSVHGKLVDPIEFDGDNFVYGDNTVRILPGEKPGQIPWSTMDVDFVIDSTGSYLKKEELERHISTGAKRVIVSRTPTDRIDRMVIHGINEGSIEKSDKIISATSSTTQVFGLMLKILNSHFGVRRAMMTTVHAYTADQPLTDAIGLDLRRSRSAAENIIPNTTSAPEILEKLMPEFKGKLDGIAFNVPVPNGSCVDMTTELNEVPTSEELNAVLKEESENSFKGLIGYTDDPIVSSDVIGREETMVFDAKATMLTADTLLKTLCWYDNGWGFSKRILDTIRLYETGGDV